MWAILGARYVAIALLVVIGLFLLLLLLRFILFCVVWMLTLGRVHVWILPNVNDETLPFLDCFKPLYAVDKVEKGKGEGDGEQPTWEFDILGTVVGAIMAVVIVFLIFMLWHGTTNLNEMNALVRGETYTPERGAADGADDAANGPDSDELQARRRFEQLMEELKEEDVTGETLDYDDDA